MLLVFERKRLTLVTKSQSTVQITSQPSTLIWIHLNSPSLGMYTKPGTITILAIGTQNANNVVGFIHTFIIA